MSQTSLFRERHVDNGASGEVGEGWSTVRGDNGREYRWRLDTVPHERGEWYDEKMERWRPPRGFTVEFTDPWGDPRRVRYYTRLVELWNKVRSAPDPSECAVESEDQETNEAA